MYTVQGFIVFLTTKKNIFVTSMSWTRYQSPQLSTPPVLTGPTSEPKPIFYSTVPDSVTLQNPPSSLRLWFEELRTRLAREERKRNRSELAGQKESNRKRWWWRSWERLWSRSRLSLPLASSPELVSTSIHRFWMLLHVILKLNVLKWNWFYEFESR